MSHCHWSSSSPLRYSCLCWCQGLRTPSKPSLPSTHTMGCMSCSQKNCPSREAQVTMWSEQPMEARTRRVLDACCGNLEIKTERQNFGSDPCQGQCFSCGGQAAAPTGAGSTQSTGSSHCSLCSIPNVTPGAVPSWPCQHQPHLFPMWWEEITDSKALSFKNNWQSSQKNKCFPV